MRHGRGRRAMFSFGTFEFTAWRILSGNIHTAERRRYNICENTTRMWEEIRQTISGCMICSGNVWEWCEDIYNSSYSNLPADGSANMSVGDSSKRVLRGGSWDNLAQFAVGVSRQARARDAQRHRRFPRRCPPEVALGAWFLPNGKKLTQVTQIILV